MEQVLVSPLEKIGFISPTLFSFYLILLLFSSSWLRWFFNGTLLGWILFFFLFFTLYYIFEFYYVNNRRINT
jgi:hypothetical protein